RCTLSLQPPGVTMSAAIRGWLFCVRHRRALVVAALAAAQLVPRERVTRASGGLSARPPRDPTDNGDKDQYPDDRADDPSEVEDIVIADPKADREDQVAEGRARESKED